MDKVKILFQDMSYGMNYRFLDEAKDKDELKKVGERNGMVLPSPDLAIFKGLYAYTDRKNKNGCELPKEEVEKALKTLNHKAVDIDHVRGRTIGHFLEAKLVNDEIIAYGCVLKSNFKEEYKEFKKMMDDNGISMSFEAWGNRIYKDASNPSAGYELKDIHFAGAGLLRREKPAFEGAEVLEFAKVIETGDETVAKEDLESSRYYLYDVQSILTALRQVECPSCKEKNYWEVGKIEFDDNKMTARCMNCDAVVSIDLTPPSKLIKKGRTIKKVNKASKEDSKIELNDEYLENTDKTDEELETEISNILEGDEIESSAKLKYQDRKSLSDDSFAIVKTVKNKITGKPRKIRMFPIHDAPHVRAALSRIAQQKVKDTLSKMGISMDSVEKKIMKRAKELNMTDLIKRHTKGGLEMNLETRIAELEKALKASIDEKDVLAGKVKDYEKSEAVKMLKQKEDEVIVLQKEVADLQKEVEDLKVKDTELAKVTKERDDFKSKLDAIEEAKRKELIKSRRDEIGEEIAKDVKDEDILDNKVYENLKLKKENAELKKADPEKAAALEAGSKDKTIVGTLADKVRKSAWGE